MVDGAWRPCSCLKRQRAADSYAAAGIPRRVASESWRALLQRCELSRAREVLEAALALQRGQDVSRWFLIHGRPGPDRDMVAFLLLKAACDGGFSALYADLPSIIDHEFDRGEGGNPYEKSVLAVACGTEPAHKWNRHVLEKALRLRHAAGDFTILLSQTDPLRLEGLYKSRSIAAAIGDAFSVVRVAPKGER